MKKKIIKPQIFKDFTSSNIKELQYFKASRDLFVLFHNGKTYQYKAVPEFVVLELTKAESVGKSFNTLIKDKYEFTAS